MRVLIDTNVLISAALFVGSTPYKAYMKAVSAPYKAMVCDQNIDEIKRIFNMKFPDRVNDLNNFLASAIEDIDVVRTPDEDNSVADEAKIRDEKDRSIFRAAVKYNADYILTGDKDFLESGIEKPKSITPAEFLEL